MIFYILSWIPHLARSCHIW